MSQSNQIQSVIEFVNKAMKLGKYNSNTGIGIINALKAAEKGLSDDEPKDIDYLSSHIEEVFLRQKNLNLSPQSQGVYFTRIKRVVSDFKKYGVDARSIYSWTPKLRAKRKNNKQSTHSREEDVANLDISNQKVSVSTEESVREVNGVKLNVVTWRLRPGVLIKVELPEDLKEQDVDKIKKLLDLEINF